MQLREEPAGLAVRDYKVPIWHKATLSFEEAAAYSGIGVNKLRLMASDEKCDFVLWNGSHRVIKRAELDKFISKSYSI